MVKLQKPLPKKFKEKAKLDNPIKKQKDKLKKDNSKSATKNISKNLVNEEISIKKAQPVTKLIKNAAQKFNDEKKSDKKQGKQTKPVVALKAKELKTNGTVEAKSTVSSQNGSTKKAAPSLKVADKKPVKPKAAKNVSEEKETIKPAKAEKIVQKTAPAPKSSLPKETVKPAKADKIVQKTAPAAKPSIVKETVKTTKVEKTLQSTVPAPKPLVLKEAVKQVKEKKAASVTKPSVPKGPPAESPITENHPPEAPVAAPKVKEGKKKTDKKSALVEGQTKNAANLRRPDKKVAKLNEKKSAKIAALKAKLHPTVAEGEETEEKEGKEKDGEEEQPVKPERKIFRYEPFPYDEKKFDSIVTLENITKVVDALRTLVQKEIANKKTAIFDDFRYMLQVGCFKIPSCPKRMVKLFLRHPMVERGDDVLFIVPDLKRGGKVDYEPTKQHYEDLLRPIGLDWITVMPMNQLRKECVTFEQKRRLCASYDHFLCDGRIVSHVVGLIGKLTQRARLTLHAVRRSGPENLKKDIECALNKTAYRQLCKSTLYTIPVATHRFTSVQVAENVVKVIRKLKHIFPGGMGNVRNLYLKIDILGTSALPFYISMAKPPEETPYVMGPREKRMMLMKQEANDVLSKFAMTKEGKLIKLTKAGVEKKRKLNEMKAALQEEEDQQPKAKKAKKEEKQPKTKNDQKEEPKVKAAAKEAEKQQPKAKNAKKEAAESKKKQKQEEVKELELPENEEDDDDETSDDDDDDEVQLGASSDEEESEDMGQFDQEEEDDQASLEAESDVEILENGLADEDDEETDDEEQEEANTSGGDDDDEEEEDEDDDDDDDEEEDEESG